MSGDSRNLTAKFGLDASGFKKGANEVRAELTELNSAMLQNKRQQKDLEEKIKSLTKQQKSNKQATDEEKKQYDELTKQIDKATLELASLKTEEQQLKIQVKETNKELSEQTDTAKKTAEAYKNVGKALATGVKFTGTAVAGMFAYTAEIAASADEINTLAKQTGLSTAEIQKFMYAAELIDVPLETLTGSMAKLVKNMNTATNGTGDAYDAFLALGVSITDSTGTLRNNQDVFDECISALSKIKDETQRDAYAMSIFGKSAQDLNPLILGGTEQLKAFGDELEREGLILSQTELDKLNEFNDKIDTFKAKFQATMAEGALEGVDAFEELFEKSDEIVDLIASLISGFAKFSGFIVDHKEAVVALVAAYGTFKVVKGIGNLIASVVTITKSFTTATQGATVAQQGMNAACNANAYVLLASALASVIGYIVAFNVANKETVETYDALEDAQKSINEHVANTKVEIELLEEKGERYEELRKKINRTADEERELYELAAEFESIYPNQIELIGDTAGAYKELGDQIERVSEELLKKSKLEATSNAYEKALADRYTKAAELYDLYIDYINTNDWENDAQKDMAMKFFEGAWSEYESFDYDITKLSSHSRDVLAELNHTAMAAIDRKMDADLGMSEESKRSAELIDELLNNQEAINKLEKDFLDLSKETASAENGSQIRKYSSEIENLSDLLMQLQENTILTVSTEKEYTETNGLSLETLKALTAAYPELQNEVNDYLNGIGSAEDVINHLNIAYQNDVANNKEALQAKLNTDTEYYQKLKEMNGSAINDLASEYGVDLSNYESYGEAKLAIQAVFLSKLASNWQKYYDAKSGQYIIDDHDLTQYKRELMLSGMSSVEAEAEIATYRTEQNQTQAAVNAWNAFIAETLDADITDYTKWYVPKLSETYTSEKDKKNEKTGASASKEASVYDQAREAYKKLVEERIAEIQKLTDAENTAADERIAAIEKEIAAREKLKDTSDLQERIDFIRGQLKYSQLEEFERFELERQLTALEDEQKDKAWFDAKNAEIEALQAQKTSRDKETAELVEQLKANQNYANTLFSDLNNGYQSVSSIVNNNTQKANINIVTDALSQGQVEQAVKDALGLGLIV